MTTGNMPNPPDQPTVQAPTAGAQAQAAVAEAEETAQVQPALSLGEDMARIIEENIDVIAQRLIYHTQLMYGVGGVGSDGVNARVAAMTLARTLRGGDNSDNAEAERALAQLGSTLRTQINDQTVPYGVNAQVAGLFEGIIMDTIRKAYQGNGTAAEEARMVLERLFQTANEKMQQQRQALVSAQSPGPHPNARQ
jgi:hypothetical protein